MINENAKVIDNYEGQIKINETDKQDLIKKMDSTTPVFEVGIEYNKETTCRDTNSPEYEYKTNNGVVVIENGYAVKKPGRENHLKSIDFGIVERSKQALELNKVIKNAKIILANGNTLINAKIVDGKLEPVNNATLLPESEGANAQLKFEIDNEILEGSELRIEYGLEVKNISEVEYLNEDFYRYGSGHGMNENDLVTLNANDVIDYLDNGININEEENQIGAIIQRETEKQSLITDGLLDESLQQVLKDTVRIFDIKSLSKDLRPIGGDDKTKISIPLITSRILANITTNEINIANSAEIIKVKKSGGATIRVNVLGNYIPSSTNHEFDDSEAPNIVVLPPTGQNLNYTSMILLAISALGLLGIGIILIKKYLKKLH